MKTDISEKRWSMSGKAIIIGAGPAGLTAAYELLNRSDIRPVIYELTDEIGGIAKTVNHNGNRMDMGGHRFFSKSDRVMNWWMDILPLQGAPSSDDLILHRKIPLSDKPGAPDPQKSDRVMLYRQRLSRIYYLRKFFDYPVALNGNTIVNLGPWRIFKIGVSYLVSRFTQIRPEKSLEDYIVNRFGRELFNTFFRDYNEKLWGVPASGIKPDWGAQRIKGLSVSKVLLHALKSFLPKKKSGDIAQKGTETSLIGQFIYPKFGPGHLWEEVARKIREKGGEICMHQQVVGLEIDGTLIKSIRVRDAKTGQEETVTGDLIISTMPVKDLVNAMGTAVPDEVSRVANGLVYRDYMTAGLLVKKLLLKNKTGIPTVNDIIPDNWIYIQQRDVKVGRLQIFNNWSPYMVKNPDYIWIGMEYFVNEGDELWNTGDKAFLDFAAKELESIGLIDATDVMDAKLVRVPKAYPAYFGTYDEFRVVREFTDKIDNLFLIGRNGMHRYNNMDHSMLAAMTAVDNILAGVRSRDNLWEVNTEEDYHEEKQTK
jgi:protoporphyrinogen oxidase